MSAMRQPGTTSRAPLLLAIILIAAQSFALVHAQEHGWADGLCETCFVGQNLDVGIEAATNTLAVVLPNSECSIPVARPAPAAKTFSYSPRAPPSLP